MNFNLKNLPQRIARPRIYGVNMVMDKGMSLQEARSFMEMASAYVDFVKLGFGTSVLTPQLKEKIEIYRSFNVEVYFGGTLFEAFYVRNQYEDYKHICDAYKIQTVEVSDGSIDMPHDEKCNYIRDLAAQGMQVLSEVGSKDASHVMAPFQWVELMKSELEAGASYVIAEAREAGNVGICRSNGEIREGLVSEILNSIKSEKVIWEAPQKSQQLYFIKKLGTNVNLGNIPVSEILPLEAMRIGLRGDTFSFFLNL